MLDCVFAAWQQGHSPEAIRSQYPALSLEEVYGTITWCLAHPGEVDQYRRRQEAVWDRWRNRAQADPPTVVNRLRDQRTEWERPPHKPVAQQNMGAGTVELF